MNTLYSRFPERRELFDSLESIADERTTLPFVHLFGLHPSESFSFLKNFLDVKSISYISLDSRLTISQRSFYHSCLSLLYYRFTGEVDKEPVESSDCFVQGVNDLFNLSGSAVPPKVVLIVQHVELLRTKSRLVLMLLPKLHELTGGKVSVVTLSYLPWSKICCFSGVDGRVVQILVRSFSKEELVARLSLRRPPEVDERIYRLYVRLTVDVLHKSCRDPTSISDLLDKNLQPFLESLGEVACLPQADEDVLSAQVWRALQPQLLMSVNLPEASIVPSKHELPLHAKFLLIAAYIASYNPPKSDRRFFVKKGDRKKISRRELRWDDRKSAHVAGPHAFPLERMFAIFLVIVGEPLEITVDIFGLVGSLRSLGYVSETSNACNLDSIRLRCLATYDTVSEIAKSVDFDLSNYLYDFVHLKLY
uniref:Origin recognition complex subunit 5 C-terminal domain-containing protein n=1 Tax=Trichuris muris TaxID=70415 RepID=A0A5S6R5E9_TRIMR